MNQLDRFREIISSYRKHGWKPRHMLMCESTRNAITDSGDLDLDAVELEVTSVDAVWFSRPSHAGREAWELRLIGDTPYALFEAFEADFDDELREEKLREMQVRLIEHVERD